MNKTDNKKSFQWGNDKKGNEDPLDKLKLKGKNKNDKIDEIVKAIRMILADDKE